MCSTFPSGIKGLGNAIMERTIGALTPQTLRLFKRKSKSRSHFNATMNQTETPTARISTLDRNLTEHGISHGQIHFNLGPEELYAEALSRGEGRLASNEALVVSTGKFTGRSPKDKFIVSSPASHENVWWGTVNREISAENFEKLYQKMVTA